MLRNQQGLSFLGFLITLLIIGILIHLMLPRYVQDTAKQQSQAKQTVENVRAQLKQAEQAAQQRANAFDNGNF